MEPNGDQHEIYFYFLVFGTLKEGIELKTSGSQELTSKQDDQKKEKIYAGHLHMEHKN